MTDPACAENATVDNEPIKTRQNSSNEELKTCRITVGELRKRAFGRDPRKTSELVSLWVGSILNNKELIFGL